MNKYQRYNDSPAGQARRARYEESAHGQSVRDYYEGNRRRQVERARRARDEERERLVEIFDLPPFELRELEPHELRVGRLRETFFKWRYYRDGDIFGRRPQRILRIGG
jgi:hypothetical protein